MPLNVRGSDSLYFKTGIDVTGLRTGATKAKGILAGLRSSITKMDVFAALGIGAAYVFARMGKAAYQFSRDFEHSMLEVSTISKMVADNFEGMSQKVINMSKRFPEDAIVLSKALYQIASAGYAGAESFGILEESAKLATAAVTDTFTAADAITSVMNAYREEVDGAAEVSDKLFTIVRLGKTTMSELGPEITMVTGLAAQAGVSFDELSAVIAESVKTLKTPIAMTGIRGMLNAILQEPTDDAKELIETLRSVGFEFSLEAVRSKGFVKFMQELNVATNGNIALLQKLFPNIRGLTGLMSVMTDKGNNLVGTLDEIKKSAGATNDAFTIMSESTANKWKIFENNTKSVLKPLGDWILDWANTQVGSINKIFEEIDRRLAENMKARSKTGEFWEELFGKKALEFKENPPTFMPPGMVLPTIDIEKQLKKIKKTFAELGIEVEGVDYRFRAMFAATGEAKWRIYEGLVNDTAAAMENLGKVTEETAKKTTAPEETGETPAKRYPENAFAFLGTPKIAFAGYKHEIDQFLSDIKTRIDEIDKATTGMKKKEEQKLSDILKDTRKMNQLQLKDYAKYLEEKIKLAEGNVALQITLQKELADVIDKQHEKEIENIRELSNVLGKLGDSISDFDAGLGKMATELSDRLSTISEMAAAPGKWGQVLGILEVASGIGQMFQQIADSGGSSINVMEKLESQLASVNEQIDRQISSIKDLDDIYKAYSKTLNEAATLKNQLLGADVYALSGTYKGGSVSLEDFLKDINMDLDTFLSTMSLLNDQFSFNGEILALTGEEIRALGSDYVDLMETAESLYAQWQADITGTTAESIADSITAGFMDGLDSAQMFGDKFEDIMKTALINTFKRQILLDYLKPFYEEFTTASEGGLTEQEIGVQRGRWITIMGAMSEQWKDMEEFFETVGFDMGDPTKTGLSGAMQGMTEQTAGLLAGQFNAMRMNSVQLNKIIEADTNRHLLAISLKDSIIANHLNEIKTSEWASKGITTQNEKHLSAISLKNSTISNHLNEIKVCGWDSKGILNRMADRADDILIINTQIADNTSYNRHLESIDNKLGGGSSVAKTPEQLAIEQIIRAVGGV